LSSVHPDVTASPTSPTLTAGKLTLAINTVTGDAKLFGYEPTVVTVNSYEIDSKEHDLNSAAWNSLSLQGVTATSGGGGWTVYEQDNSSVAESTSGAKSYNNVGTGSAGPVFDIGDIYTPGTPQDLVFTAYNSGFNEDDAAVQYYTPEPGSFGLIILSGLGLLRRRRPQAAVIGEPAVS
jgi:hypothetical protein